MKKNLFLIFAILGMVEIGAVANDSTLIIDPLDKALKTGGMLDEDIRYVAFKELQGATLYTLSTRKNYPVDGNSFHTTGSANAILKDKLLATRIMRQEFTVDEMMILRDKGILKGSISISVAFDPQGHIFEVSFSVFHRGDPQVKQILTPARFKRLFIEFRDQIHYTMPKPYPNQEIYFLMFNVKFSDILLNLPILTN